MAARNGLPDDVLGDLYPFEDRYVTLDDGVQMHYIEMGTSSLWRPTILLLHGNPTWSFLYREWMTQLSKVGRVIAIDHVGFGRSDHPEDPAYYSLERHISNLEQFAAKLGLKRVIPVMQDWGGPIGLGWATRHPEAIKGLVILNTWAFTEKVPMKLPAFFRFLRSRGIGEYVFGQRNAFVEKLLPRLVQTPLAPAVMDGYRHPYPTPAARVAIVQSTRMIPDRRANPNWETMDRIEKALPTLNVPAKILWATHDPAFPKRFAWGFKEMLPKAEEPQFLEAGHYLQEDIPRVLVPQVAAFVKSL